MKKQFLKMVLDFLLALAFALLMNPRVFNGLPFHEIAGLVFGIVIFIHIGLNFQWVKNTTLNMFNSNLPKKTRFNYLLNILLFISMATIIVTGILISKVVFPNLSIEGNRIIRALHDLSSYTTLAIIGIHVGVHWQWVMAVCKKMFKSTEGKPRKGAIAITLFALLILAGGIQWYSSTSSQNAAIFHSSAIQPNSLDREMNMENTRVENDSKFSDEETFNFHRTDNREFHERHGRGEFGHHGRANSFLVILTYFMILAAVIVPAYYLEKRVLR